jgi:hypothetical protein
MTTKVVQFHKVRPRPGRIIGVSGATPIFRPAAKLSLKKMLGIASTDAGIDPIDAKLPGEREQAIGMEAEHLGLFVTRRGFVERWQRDLLVVLDRKAFGQIVANLKKACEVGVIRPKHRQGLLLHGIRLSLVVCKPAITRRFRPATPVIVSRPLTLARTKLRSNGLQPEAEPCAVPT